MRLDLAASAGAGRVRGHLDIAWRFTVPDYGAGRMGRDGALYEIGQWYPRMAVYDDVRGWNHEPYIGGGEFYLEYGSFDVALTVPASLHRRRHRHAPESRAGADRRAAGSARPSARARPSRWRSSPRTRRAIPSGPARRARASSPGASPPTAFATSPSAPRPISGGMRAATRGRWSTPCIGRPRPNGRRPTGWCATGSSTTASSGIPIPMRTSPASKGRSRGWSTP